MAKIDMKAKMRARNAKKSKDAKQNKRIKKLENIVYPSLDWKTKDTKAIQASIANTPYQNYPMFALGKGDGDNQRSGDKVSLRHGTLHLTLTRGDTSNIFRVMVVRTPSATFAGLSDVLEYHNFATDGELVFGSPLQVKAYEEYYDINH